MWLVALVAFASPSTEVVVVILFFGSWVGLAMCGESICDYVVLVFIQAWSLLYDFIPVFQ
jgi:hypothetical protein